MEDEVPAEVRAKILNLKEQMYSKGSIVREVKKITKDKELARQYVEIVLHQRKTVYAANPELYKDKALQQFYFGIAFIVIPVLLVVIFPDVVVFRVGIIVGPIYLLLALYNYIQSQR